MTLAPSRPDHAREIRNALVDAAHVCERLGLIGGRGTFVRQAGGGVTIRCPEHDEKTPSCSVRRGPDGTLAIRCFGCQWTGVVLSLVASVNGLNTKRDFRLVLRAAAELAGLWGIISELESGATEPDRICVVPSAPAPEPERDYPPQAEVDEVWASAGTVDADEETAAWIRSRGLRPEAIAGGDLARSIPKMARLPWWASYQRSPWTITGHRLLMPMRNARGDIRSLRAGRIVEGETPKRLPPGGHKATGLVMACGTAVSMLQGAYPAMRVVVVEGEPDFLTWATRPGLAVTARIGIVSGSWTKEIASRIPPQADVVVRTDRDRAGDEYARQIQATLRHRCFVRRGARADG